MANFYAKLKHLVSDCDTSYIEPLSYIKHVIAESTRSDKIVLLYRKVRKLLTNIACCCFVKSNQNKLNDIGI